MSNKPRPPMSKPEEVIAWAEETANANGEAFTMLKKEEQLLIAKFLLAMRDHIKKLQSKGEDAPTEDAKPDHPAQPEKEEVAAEPKVEPQEERVVVEGNETITLKQTNMDFFRANAVPMQRAWQLFQTWQDCDPTNRTVVDERRKAYLMSAAFAFWLNLPHE